MMLNPYSSLQGAILTGADFVFIDGKADVQSFGVLSHLVVRHELRRAELKTRCVKFLPKQVLRRLYKENGVLLDTPSTV